MLLVVFSASSIVTPKPVRELANCRKGRKFKPGTPANFTRDAMTQKMNSFRYNGLQGTKLALVAGILMGNLPLVPVIAQSAAPAPVAVTTPTVTPPRSAEAAAPAAPATRYQPNRFAGRAARYYALFWGIESPSVKAAEAGELIRFTYHVLDPERAKAINDNKNDAYLIFPEAKIRLSVPSFEKVGQMRQSSAPEAGKTYWMAFSNPGRRVKRGDRVDVVIGLFHAEGLVVE